MPHPSFPQAIRGHSPEPESSRSISPQLPLRRYNSVLTIAESSNAELAKPPLPPRPASLLPPTGRRRSSTVTGVSKPDHSPASIPIFRTSSMLSLNEEPNDGNSLAVVKLDAGQSHSQSLFRESHSQSLFRKSHSQSLFWESHSHSQFHPPLSSLC